MKLLSGLFVLQALLACSSVFATGTPSSVNVKDYGARGDGVTIDTAAINSAIAAASAAGGGTVDFPSGDYLSTSIHLQSNITLFLEQGATIQAASDGNGVIYDPAEPNPAAGAYQDFGHTHFHNSLIWGENLSNISIIGPGRIWGAGLVRDQIRTDTGGNKAIALKLCRNVILRDFTLQHGGWFGILATGVDNLTIDNLKIDTNRDGMDIDCCQNVRVSNCTVNSPRDDGICLKSSYALGYAQPTKNVTISNCLVSGFDEGTVLDGTYLGGGGCGRIKFGTESNGGFINITITNCIFDSCNGLALETVDGALLEDVCISNITMRNIASAPIFLRLGARLRGPAGTVVGELQRINISNVTVYDADKADGCIIAGIPGHAIKDITLSNIQIWTKGGGTVGDAARVLPELEGAYPEPSMFGTTPSYGFFVRHVSGITFDNIQLHTLLPDSRPAFVFDDVSGARAINTDGLPKAH
jgi:polygalacturonase